MSLFYFRFFSLVILLQVGKRLGFLFFLFNDLFYAHLELNRFAFTLFVFREIKWKEHLSLSSLYIFQLKEKRTILLSSACLSLNHIGFTHGKGKTL